MLYPTTKTAQPSLPFKTTELAVSEYDIFKIFHIPSTFGNGNGNEAGGIVLSGLVCLITGYMEHIGRDSRTSHTDTQSRP
jgi:hypothetical protein